MSEIIEFLRALWRDKPIVLILFGLGLLLFLFFVIDTYRHRKHRKQYPGRKPLH